MENNSYPVSIEIFAAYMDGNLSIEEMHNIESLINNNNSLCHDSHSNNLLVGITIYLCE